MKLTPFKRWTIENFPFIEADFDAITNYQLYCKIVEYLNKVIASQNATIEQVNAMQEYLDSLDIQELVDNKLDEMAESGQLTDIIAQYLNLAGVLAYNTIADLEDATNIVAGSICYTLGQNTYNDGKGAFYKVRNVTTSDTIDGFNIVRITNDNTIIAERLSNYYINALDSRVTALENADTKYFVLFGDSWSDFGAGFENWYSANNIGNVLDCELLNFAIGGASFITTSTLIDSEITTAQNTLTAYQKEHTKYVVIEGGVNDMTASPFSDTTWANAVTHALIRVTTIFPNAKVIFAPNMCSPGLNVNRASVCFYENMNYITHHLPYITGNVSVPNNLPFFWIGHYASEVFRSDNLHVNQSGAKAFGKQILNAFTGDNQVMNYSTIIGTTSLHVQMNSQGYVKVHGNYTATSSTSVETLASSNKITEYQKIFLKYNGGSVHIGSDGNANTIAWVNINGDNIISRAKGTTTYYF